MSRFAVTGRRVLVGAELRPAAVVIDGQVIEAVIAPEELEAGLEVPDVIDAGDLVVMPGLIDCHVHVNEPGRTEWEGFETATRAAAAGGVTALVDMPLNCIPVTTTRAALEAKLAAIAGTLWVDVGFWGGVVPGNAGELGPLAAAGALGCKAFLCHSGIDEFPNSTEADLRAAMPLLREAGIPLLAHAELEGPLPRLAGEGSDSRAGLQEEGADPRGYRSYLESRPAEWEDAAIALLIRLCRETGCAVHIVHLSAASSLPQLAAARAEGLPITVETCPHYLCLEAESIPDGATTFKCAPPIRDARNRDALWAGLAEGIIDLVVTDHSPCTPGLKDGDFHQAWGGISSLQLGLPAVWTEAAGRGHSIAELARWMAAAPAAFAGIGGKGALAPGRDADLVLWDPDATFEVRPELLHARHKHSPYLGRTLRGRVHRTYLRGACIYDRDRAEPFCAGPNGRPILSRQEAP